MSFKKCVVKTQPIDEYTKDIIPDRCLRIVDKARALGLNNFYVAYPVLEQQKMRDPIIIGCVKEIDKS